MPIQHLEELLRERSLIHQDALVALRDTRVGIEGMDWLKRLGIQEPCQVAIGGIPMTLEGAVAQSIAQFKRAGIQPVFVFNGLDVKRNERQRVGQDTRALRRDKAWDAYEQGNPAEAAAQFGQAITGPLISVELIAHLFKYLREQEVEYVRAPYLSWAQLSYFMQEQKVHCVYSALETLLFAPSRLILDVNFEAGTFTWIDGQELLDTFQLSHDQFLDACILSGISPYIPSFPQLAERPRASFTDACEMVARTRSGVEAIQKFGVHATHDKLNYLDGFLQTKVLFKHHLVFNLRGECEPLNKEACPNDLHEIVGPRLPNDLYFFVCLGIVAPQAINNLLSGKLPEFAPLADSDEYHHLLDLLIHIRAQTLGCLALCLNEYFRDRRVVTQRWYDSQNEQPLVDKDGAVTAGVMEHLSVSQAAVERLLVERPEFEDFVTINFCLEMQSEARTQLIPLLPGHDGAGGEMEALRHAPAPMTVTSMEAYLCLVLLSTLELRGYLMPMSHKLTMWGFALKGCKNFSEEAFVALELFKYGHLTGKPLNLIRSNDATVPRHVMDPPAEHCLIARVFALLPVQFNGRPFTTDGPLDRSLMAFTSVVKATRRSLRNMLEMVALSSFLRQRARVPAGEYPHLPLFLPLFADNTAVLGMAGMAFLQRDLADLQPMFPACTDIVSDLQDAMYFWDEVFGMVEFLAGQREPIANRDIALWRRANAMLREKRAAARMM